MTVMSFRRSVITLAGAAALVAAACGPALAVSGRGAAARGGPGMLQAGQVAGRSAVPWRLVGPGWTLAVVDTAPQGVLQHAQVVLIDPSGGRYAIFNWPGLIDPKNLMMIDWSGDRQRALFSPLDQTERYQLTLRTGTLTRVVLPRNLYPVGYTTPLGNQLLAIGPHQSIARVSLTGRVIKWLTHGFALNNNQAVMSPGGQWVASSQKRGVVIINNASDVIRHVAIPGANPTYGCDALRWWNATQLLVTCAKHLWLVPARHGAPVALTKRPQTQLFEGWQAGRSLFVVTSLQWSLHPGCTAALKRQGANGSLVVVEAPGLGCNSGGVAASVGGRLLLLGFPFGLQQASGSLRWYNPVTGKVRILYKAMPGTPGIVWLDPFGSNGQQDLLLES